MLRLTVWALGPGVAKDSRNRSLLLVLSAYDADLDTLRMPRPAAFEAINGTLDRIATYTAPPPAAPTAMADAC